MGRQSRIFINRNEFFFEPGETILEVAQRNQIDIPTLCYIKTVRSSGKCGICVVEIKGADELAMACSTPAADRMTVFTESLKVIESRRKTISEMLCSGNHNCAVRGHDDRDWTKFQLDVQKDDKSDKLCPMWGDCRLQELAYRYQVTGSGRPGTRAPYPVEDVNPFIVRDFSRCILCGRCVRVCNEVQVNNAIDFGYEGTLTKIITLKDMPLKNSDCVFCGECVQACPVGALVEKNVRCRYRPWETEKVRTTCTYCGVGCQIYLHVKDNRVVKVTGVEDAAPNYGSLCVKGKFGFEFINSAERLTTPLIKEDGGFRDATWEEALNLVANRLGGIKNDYGPDSIGMLTSARTTNEDNYIAQKFVRSVLKTNNVDHCARLCHASTVAGLAAAFGSGAMTNPIGDIEKADLILITGSNTTETHPVISGFVKRAVQFKGAKLIVVDPRYIKIAEFAHIWLRQNLGTDVAWINGLIYVIIKENLYDKEFVGTRTTGFDELKNTVEKYTPEYVEKIAGISAKDIIKIARLYAEANPASIIYCMGITQHTTGTDNVKSLANLAMLCGNIGIRGGGVNPLRGQNNVQGACDMGALPNVFSGYQTVTDPEIRKKMEKVWGIADLPDKPGLTATEMIPGAHAGKLKALYIIGENPLVSDPDTNHTEKCLADLDFLVVQDIFMTETARLADVLLPASCFAEKDGTFTNTERLVQRLRKGVKPPGRAMGDWEIICEIATRMGCKMSYKNSRAVMEEISSVTPSYAGIKYDRIEDQGICWPCPDAGHPGTPVLHVNTFTRGKGLFHAVDFIPPAENPDDKYPLYLTTGRLLYHYHTGTMTRRTEGLNERAPECYLEISPEDIRKYRLEDGSMARISSRRGSILARVKSSGRAVEGTLFIPFHFAEAAANRLTIAALDPVAGIPELKVCAVKLAPFGQTFHNLLI